MIDLLAAALLASCLAILVFSSIRSGIVAFALNSLVLAGATIVVGISSDSAHLYWPAALTIVAKVIVIPWLLLRSIKETGARREPGSKLSLPIICLIAAALIIFSFILVSPIQAASHGVIFGNESLGAGVSLMMIGFLIMSLRRKAVSQIIGLLTLENGLFFAAITATHGMPLIVELGIFFDIVVGVVIFAALTRQMNVIFSSTDTASLRILNERSQ